MSDPAEQTPSLETTPSVEGIEGISEEIVEEVVSPEEEAKQAARWNTGSHKGPVRETSQYKKTKGTFGAWVRPFTRFHQIPVVRRTWIYLFFMAIYVLIVGWVVDQKSFPSHQFKEAGTATLTGVILGMLLVFRTNSAYERWSEGRRMWGQLVNDSRNLCLKVQAFVNVGNQEKMEFAELVISFAYSLKHHLRDTRPNVPLPGLTMASMNQTKHLPVYLANMIFDRLAAWQKMGKMPEYAALQLDAHSRGFMDICGACERIRSTPLAVSYRAFMRQGIALNLLAIPWYVVPELSLIWALPIIMISAYFLIGLELIAEEIEDPFGQDGDDLPLDTICDTIRKTIGAIISVKKKTQSFTVSHISPFYDPLKDGD